MGDVKTYKCQYCNADGFYWQKTRIGWRLVNAKDEIHVCPVRAKQKNISRVLERGGHITETMTRAERREYWMKKHDNTFKRAEGIMHDVSKAWIDEAKD